MTLEFLFSILAVPLILFAVLMSFVLVVVIGALGVLVFHFARDIFCDLGEHDE